VVGLSTSATYTSEPAAPAPETCSHVCMANRLPWVGSATSKDAGVAARSSTLPTSSFTPSIGTPSGFRALEYRTATSLLKSHAM